LIDSPDSENIFVCEQEENPKVFLLCITNSKTWVVEVFQSGKVFHRRKSSKSTVVHQWVRGYFMEANVTERDGGR